MTLALQPVDASNWRDVARIAVRPEQQAFVAHPAYYLAMCAYGDTWQPLAVAVDGEVIGFLMWAVDPEDGACWLGGILVDATRQGRGLGQAAVREAMRMLHDAHGHTHFALSYQPENAVARRAYAAVGFAETGEVAEDEVVARTTYAG